VSTPGPIVATYKAGTSLVVAWDTTLLHTSSPGVRIAIQYSSTDGFNNNVLVNGQDIGILGTNSINVTLPVGKTSSSAILQWVWASTQDGGYYLGCSDISIVASGNLTAPTCAASLGNTVFAPPGPGISGTNPLVPVVMLFIILMYFVF